MSGTVEERLARIEQLLQAKPAPAVAAPEARSVLARAATWMGAELPKLVAAAVVLVLGFALKDSVDLAIKQRQLDLSYTKEMQGLLIQLGGKGSEAELGSAATLLASYGEPALPGLMSHLRQSGMGGTAAAEGLNVLALREPELVCAALPRVLGLRQQYEWQAQEKVVLMLGQHGCGKARPALRRYRGLVEAALAGRPAGFEALVRVKPDGPAEVYPRLLKSVDAALAMLDE